MKNKKNLPWFSVKEQKKIIKVLILVSSILLFVAVIFASNLGQKYPSILFILPIIIVTIIGLAVNIAYWVIRKPKSKS